MEWVGSSVLQLRTRGALSRGPRVPGLRVRLGEATSGSRIERTHAQGLFVGGDRLRPLRLRGARHAEGDRGDGVVIIGGDERGRELDRAVVAPEVDERARELARDE